MTRIFTTGFETGALDENNGVVVNMVNVSIGVQSTTKRTGNYACQVFKADSLVTIGVEYDAYFTQSVGGVADIYIRFAFRYSLGTNTAGAARDVVLTLWDAGGANSLTLSLFTSDALLRVYQDATGPMGRAGGTLLSTGSIPLKSSTWYIIEWHVDSTTSTVKVNGVTDQSYIGVIVPTQTVVVGSCNNSTSYGIGADYFIYDDVAINDTSGSYQNSWVGIGGTYLLMPTADGATTAWTPSTGSDHYALVDELPANTTDWVQSSGTAQVELFEVADCPLYVTTINMVQVLYATALTASGSATVQDVVRQGTINYAGTAQTVVSIVPSYVTYTGVAHYVQPNGSGAWGTVEVNALQAGFQIP